MLGNDSDPMRNKRSCALHIVVGRVKKALRILQKNHILHSVAELLLQLSIRMRHSTKKQSILPQSGVKNIVGIW